VSDQRTAKNLRLEDDEGESATYIRLEDTGRDLADRWRLQAGETPTDWQPVEYDRPSRRGGGWILPLLIGVVVVGVAGSLLYFGVTRLLNSDIATQTPENDATNITTGVDNDSDSAGTNDTDSINEVVEPAVTTQATNTPEVAVIETPGETDFGAEPTAVLVEEEVAIINSEYGVNARLEPSTTADVLRVLEQNEEVTILDRLIDEENDIEWLQVLTSEDAEVWISSAFVDITTRLVADDGGEVADEQIGVGDALDGAAVGEEDILDPLDSSDSVSSVDVTISSPSGLNARTNPSADAELVSVLEDGQALKAIRRSDDEQWVLVELEEGQTGWIFLELVTADDDLSVLPSGNEAANQTITTGDPSPDDVEPEGTVGEANTDDEADSVPDVEVDPETVDDDISGADVGSSIPVIANQYGVNARSTTSTEGAILQVVEGDAELVAIGRSEDSTWVQVPLDDGTLSWIFAEALIIDDDINTLPVATPPAVGAPAEILSDPLAAPASVEPENSDEDESPETSSGGITTTVPISLTVAITGTNQSTAEPVTTTGGLTSTIDSGLLVTTTEAVSDAVAIDGPTATIISLIDAKARPIPSAGEASIRGIPNGDVLSAIGRSANNFWVQVELADGTEAWVFANNVALSVDISELPEVTPEE